MRSSDGVGHPGSHEERMLARELYQAGDPDLAIDGRRAFLVEWLGSIGERLDIRRPLYCDYGNDITIETGAFLNFGVTLLDVAPIRIGNDIQVGPNAQFLTTTHPLEPEPRRDKWEPAKPITIGNNAWIEPGAINQPGITIDENTVVGAGAIVTRDLPANVLAVGNPSAIQPASSGRWIRSRMTPQRYPSSGRWWS